MLQADSADRYQITDDHLKEVIYTKLQIEDDEELNSQRLKEITSLNLSNEGIKDITGLEHFTNLETLNLSGNHITEFEELTKLKQLKELDLSFNKIESIDPLERMPTIENLNLEGNRITSVQPLKKMASLLALEMADNRIRTISALSSLVYLQELDLRGNYVNDISALENLPNLRTLDARYNFITDLSPLANMSLLTERLLLKGNQLQSVKPIAHYYDAISETDLGELPLLIELSERGGLKENAVTIELSLPVDSDAVIHYTTDASTPDENAPIYDGPLELTESSVLSAVSISPTGDRGTEVRETYLIQETPNLPIISLSTDPRNLFDEEIGIYIPGDNFNPALDRATSGNYAMTGHDWERPVKVEHFDESGDLVLSTHAGMRIHGGASRAYDQKSLRLYARNEYGNNTFNYSFFGDDKRHLYKRLLLRNSGNDYNSTLFRDAYLQSLVKDEINVETQDYNPVVVYINGEYWGIHNIRERFDQHYFERELGIHQDDLDLLEKEGEIEQGRNAHWNSVIEYIREHDLSEAKHYEQVAEWIDLDNFINYNITEIFVRNTDWPGNNRVFYRNRKENDPWKHVLFDLDFGFGRFGGPDAYRHYTLQMATEAGQDSMPNPDWSTLVLRSLMENDEFQTDYINRSAHYLNTLFHPERSVPLLEEMAITIEPEIGHHIDRWQHPSSYEDWVTHLNRMKQFAIERPEFMFAHLSDYFNLQGYGEVELDEALRKQLSVNGYSLWRDDLPGNHTFRFMTNVPLSFSHTDTIGRITSSNEEIVQVVGNDKVILLEKGEATLELFNKDDRSLGTVSITVSHYEKDQIALSVGEHTSLADGSWLTSDEETVAIDGRTATALVPGTALLTRKEGTDIIELITIQVTD